MVKTEIGAISYTNDEHMNFVVSDDTNIERVQLLTKVCTPISRIFMNVVRNQENLQEIRYKSMLDVSIE